MKNTYQLIPTLTAFTVLSLAISAPVMATSFYSITDLGTLGGSRSDVTGINDSGQVIGTSDTANGAFHNFLWSQSTGMQDLDTIISQPLRSQLNASSINNPFYRPSIWGTGTPSSNSYPICPDSYCSISISPTAINNSGQILGYWSINGQFKESGMFFMNKEGQVYNLGSFGGVVEGPSIWRPGHTRVSTWPPQVICFNEGNMRICRSPSGMSETVFYRGNLSSEASSFGISDIDAAKNFYLNDIGQVFGYTGNSAFFWSERGGMRFFGNVGNNWANPNNIFILDTWRNTTYNPNGPNGVRVGIDWANGGAVIWENDVMTNLNTLIPDDSGWFLSSATSINTFGQIVGSGLINGQQHAFLLTPVSEVPSQETSVPEPSSTFSLLGFGAVGIGALLKRKQQQKTGSDRKFTLSILHPPKL